MPRQIKLLEDEWPEWAGADPAPPKASPEDLFAAQLGPFKNLVVIRQLLFAKALMQRMWKFDFAFPDYHIAVEIEGLVPRRLLDTKTRKMVLVVYGGHATITGIKEDMEKYNAAALLGWTVLRFEQKDVKPRHAIDMTLRVLAARGWRA